MSIMEFLKADSLMFLQQSAHAGFGYCKFENLARFYPSLLLLDSITLGFPLSLQNLARIRDRFSVLGWKRLDTFMFVLDSTTVGSSWSIRQSVFLTNSLAIHNYGIKCKRVQCESSLSVRSFMLFGSSFSLFDSARVGGDLSALDYLHLGSPPLVRSSAQFDTRLFALDFLQPGPTSFLRGVACTDPLLFGFGHLAIDSLMLLQSISKLDSAPALCGFARTGLLLPASGLSSMEALLTLQTSLQLESALSQWDSATLGSILSSRSFACFGSVLFLTGCRGLDFLLPVSDSSKVASFLPLQNSCQTESAIFLSSLSCPEFTSLVFDLLSSGTLSLLRSLSHTESMPPVFERAVTESFLSLQRAAQPDFTMLPLFSSRVDAVLLLSDVGILEVFLSLKASAHAGMPTPILSRATLDSLSFVLDFLSLGTFSSPRSTCHCGSSMPIPTHACLESFLLLHASQRFGSSFFLCKASCLESAPLVLDFSSLGSSPALRGFAHLDFPTLLVQSCSMGTLLLVFDSSNFESCTSVRSHTRIGGSMDLERLESWKVDVLDLTDKYTQGSSLLLQSLARTGFRLLTCTLGCLDSSLPTLDFALLDLPSSIQAPVRQGLKLSVVGCTHVGLMLSALDTVNMGLALLPRSMAQPGLSVFTFAFAHLAFLPLARSMNWSDALLSILGLARCGAATLLLDAVLCGSFPLLRSFNRLESAMSTFGMLKLELSLTLHRFARSETPTLLVGLHRMNLSVFALDFLSPEPFLPLQTPG